MRQFLVGAVFLTLAGLAEAQVTVGTSSPLVAGYVGSTYCFLQNAGGTITCPGGLIQLTGAGGTGPYTFAVSAGALPPGISIRAVDSVLDGKPITTGTFSFSIRATDSKSATGTAAFSITVNPAFVAALSTYVVGVPLNLVRTCSSNPISSGLPPGLTLTAGGGIVGTPTTAGVFTETFSCANITVFAPYQINGALSAAPSSLTFSGTSNGATSRAVAQIGNQTAGQTFTVRTGTGTPWLAAAGGGTTPGPVTATVNPAGLAAGKYNGTLVVTTTGASPSTLSIPVTYTVSAAAPAKLVAAPVSLDYSILRNAPAVSKTVLLSNAGAGNIGPINFQIVGINSPDVPSHVHVSPASGTVTASTPLSITVTADANLTGAIYTGSLIGTTAARPILNLPLILQIAPPATPRFRFSQSAIFLGAFGDGPGIVRQPITHYLDIYGDATVDINAGIFPGGLFQGSPWLTVNPSGPLRINPTGGRLTLTANPTGLSVGDHYGLFEATGYPYVFATSQIETTTVVFRVIPPNAPGGFFPVLDKAIVFTPSERDPINVALTTINSTPLPVTLTTQYNEGQSFLTVTPAATTTVAGNPAVITLSLSGGGITGGLPDLPNIVTGDLVIQPGTIVFIKKLLNAADAIGRQAICQPTTLVPVRASPLQNFVATAGLPLDLNVTVVDDCGSFTSASSVSARFSNGDPPVELVSVGNGRFTGSWSGRTVSDGLALTIVAFSADQSLTGSSEVGGILEANANQPPMVFDGGVLNGASFAIGGPLSPGSFVTLFGERLSNSQLKAPSVPLPTTLAGSSLLIAGQPAPVFFTSDGQMNAIIPYGIPTDGPVPVTALRDSVFAPTKSVPIVPAAPGIFMYGDRQGIIVGPTILDLANSDHPVKGGDVVVVYCTGLGEVNPTLAAGSPTPTAFFTRTVNTVTMTIGGIAARVDFSGLTPGSTGLYQVNAVVPAGVTPGDRVPVVLTAAGQLSAPAFISIR
ncbi:MAG: putative Ig domain-containing protein [Acidobacteriota bacterium]